MPATGLLLLFETLHMAKKGPDCAYARPAALILTKKRGGMSFFISYKFIFRFQHLSHCYAEYIMPATGVLLLFETWQVTEKGPDRVHTWPAALAHPKKKGLSLVYIYRTLNLILKFELLVIVLTLLFSN